MHDTALPAKPRGLALMLGWRRIRFTLGLSIVCGLVLPYGWNSRRLWVVTGTVILGLIAMLMFGLFEQWPKRLPRWLERWVRSEERRAGKGRGTRSWQYRERSDA